LSTSISLAAESYGVWVLKYDGQGSVAQGQLAGWFAAAMQSPEVKPKLAVQALLPVAKCGADFTAHLRKQYNDYGRVIREANIKAE